MFFTGTAWDELRSVVTDQPACGVFEVPMYRVPDNALLSLCEPQIMFHRSVNERFEPMLPYGMGPKVEMLFRLGITGPWDDWPGEAFTRLRQIADQKRSDHKGKTGRAGRVYRLSTGTQDTISDPGPVSYTHLTLPTNREV